MILALYLRLVADRPLRVFVMAVISMMGVLRGLAAIVVMGIMRVFVIFMWTMRRVILMLALAVASCSLLLILEEQRAA